MKATWTQDEVCALTGLEPHILRFWESEFSQLRPRFNSARQRVYREQDVEIVKKLKSWIYDEGLAIPAARRRLKEECEEDPVPVPEEAQQLGMDFLSMSPTPEADPLPMPKIPLPPPPAPAARSVLPPAPSPERPAPVMPVATAVPESPAPAEDVSSAVLLASWKKELKAVLSLLEDAS